MTFDWEEYRKTNLEPQIGDSHSGVPQSKIEIDKRSRSNYRSFELEKIPRTFISRKLIKSSRKVFQRNNSWLDL